MSNSERSTRGALIAALLAHAFRVLLVVVTMVLVAIGLWLIIGILSATTGIQSPRLVLLSVTAIALAAVSSGGYISARYITPTSLLHPIVAASLVGVLAGAVFTSGDTGALAFGVPIAAAIVAAIGALVARR